MRKKAPNYWLWSEKMLRAKWNRISDQRENLVNRISKYDVQMQEIKDILKRRALP